MTSYSLAFGDGGPVAITWGRLLVGAFSILVSMAMGEIASSMPTAGALYFWSSKLGSPAWGWFTGWFNLIGHISVTADLIRSGKVRTIGSTPASAIVEAQWVAERRGPERFRIEQPPYSLLDRAVEREILPVAQRHGMGVMVWGPLAQGMLTGRVRKNQENTLRRAAFFKHLDDERRINVVEQLIPLAEKAGMPLTHLAMAFTIAHPGVTSALAGARTSPPPSSIPTCADARQSNAPRPDNSRVADRAAARRPSRGTAAASLLDPNSEYPAHIWWLPSPRRCCGHGCGPEQVPPVHAVSPGDDHIRRRDVPHGHENGNSAGGTAYIREVA